MTNPWVSLYELVLGQDRQGWVGSEMTQIYPSTKPTWSNLQFRSARLDLLHEPTWL